MEQLDIKYGNDLETTAAGDLCLSTAQRAISQRLYARLITNKGTLVHRPDFGIGIKSYQGKIFSVSTQIDLAKGIEEQFLRDPDVESVDLVSFKDVGGGRFDITVKYKITGSSLVEEQFKPFSGVA